MAKKKSGRPSKYEQLEISKKLKSIEGWARQGSTNADIAEMLGVSEAAFYAWKGRYPDFREAIRAGAREANGEILNSAFRQATGYYAKQREVVKLKRPVFVQLETKDGETEKKEPVLVTDDKGHAVYEDVADVVEYEAYFPPDARMTQFMIVNRLKEDYKQKVEATLHDDENTGVVAMPEVIKDAEPIEGDLVSAREADTVHGKAGV